VKARKVFLGFNKDTEELRREMIENLDKRWSSGLVWMLMMRLYEAFFQRNIVREGHPLWHWYIAGEEKIEEIHGGWE
jgi:hypothetical protein